MSKHNEWKKTKTIYWKDELHDDFDEVGLERPNVPFNYHYIRKNPINAFFSGILYHAIAVPVLATYCFLHGIRVENKRYYKKIKRDGGFIYANHVALSDVFKFQALISFGKRINILGYSDILSVPVVKHIVRALGYLPLPLKDDKDNFAKLMDSMSYYIKKKHQAILIYPEAHIWPYYTKIRNFPNNSFIYPSKILAPVIPAVTVWKERKFRKTPRQVIRIGKPIYPLPGVSIQENKEHFLEECKKQMLLLSNVKQQEYIKYIKQED